MKAALRDDLVASHQRRLGTSSDSAQAAVDDVLTQGPHSPHQLDVMEALYDPQAAFAHLARNALATPTTAALELLSPLMDWARTPPGLAALTHWSTLPHHDPPCVCLCPLTHPTRPSVCEGIPTTIATRTSPTTTTAYLSTCHTCARELTPAHQQAS